MSNKCVCTSSGEPCVTGTSVAKSGLPALVGIPGCCAAAAAITAALGVPAEVAGGSAEVAAGLTDGGVAAAPRHGS